MNVFVLNTGRCGSRALRAGLKYLTNYTVGHESCKIYDLEYTDNHIEIDNRLSWFLGSLSKKYPSAFYVHLTRDPEATATSFLNWKPYTGRKILPAYVNAMKQGKHRGVQAEAASLVETVNDNITEFLRDKPHVTLQIENPEPGLQQLWAAIGADGDLAACLKAMAAWSSWDSKTR